MRGGLYTPLVTASASLFAALAATLLFAPGIIFWLFALPGAPDAVVMSARAAALFAGLATLCAMGARARIEETRRLVLATLAVLFGALIGVGLVHLLRGAVGPGILLAIGGEAAFLLGCVLAWQETRGRT